MTNHRLTRSIPCLDTADRSRVLRVIAEPGSVWLVSPPGGSARLEPSRIEELKGALTDALVHAARETRS